MAKRKSDGASEPGLKKWNGKTRPEFPAEFAARVQQIAEDYFRQSTAMGAEFTLPTRSAFFVECMSQVRSTLRATVLKSLSGSLTEIHRAAVEAGFRSWIAGGAVFQEGGSRSLPKVAARDSPKLTALFERTTIQHYEWSESVAGEEGNEYEIKSRCEFTIGDWKASATWWAQGASWHGEGPETKLTLTDYDRYAVRDLSIIEKHVKSELPPHLLGAFLYLVAFDLVNRDFYARPLNEHFPALSG